MTEEQWRSHKPVVVADVVRVVDRLTGGRLMTDSGHAGADTNPFVVLKSSGIAGKAVMETPGLIWGDLEKPVQRIAVVMTLTEVAIELAQAVNIDLIVAHHPVADAASSGGVPLANYLSLYNVAVIEVHEALHGLHPGIPWLHGHWPERTELAYGGVPGNIMVVGSPLPGVVTADDIVKRLATLMDLATESSVLEAERAIRTVSDLHEAVVAAPPCILNGAGSALVRRVLHIFPHTGFSVADLRRVLSEHPDIDTVIASISRVSRDHALVQAARELGLTFIAGNTHALEIVENGLPLAYGLQQLLPDTEVLIFRERIVASSFSAVGTAAMQQYGRDMAEQYLLMRARGVTPNHNPSLITIQKKEEV